MSPSRQFIIYGVDTALRGAVSEMAESTKANLLALLRLPDGWRTPVIINLQLPQANLPETPPVAFRFSQTGFGLKLQLDLTVARGVEDALVERELLRAIFLEMIYRNQPGIAPGTPFVEPPDWLLDGVLALTPGRDRGSLVEALLLSDKAMPLEKFLHQRPALLDSPARLLYRAYSMTLVQLLVDGTNGPAGLARYIGNLSRGSNDSLADLKAEFPAFSSGVEKAWRASVARLSASQSHRLLTFAETSRRLDELLRIGISDTGHSRKLAPLDDFWQREISPAERVVLNSLVQNFVLLAARAHPVLRAIVEEYQQIAALLAAGKRHNMAERLTRLKATHAKISACMSGIDDYMNWFEATQSKTPSGLFANYLSAAREQIDARPRRRDALSLYLDALEEQF